MTDIDVTKCPLCGAKENHCYQDKNGFDGYIIRYECGAIFNWKTGVFVFTCQKEAHSNVQI